MDRPETEVVDCDVLIVGGGMAGCGAAYEAAYWAKQHGLRAVIVEKAAMERSGAVAMGLSAINCYMGMRWGENTPEDFVRYVRNDLMGLSREDLVSSTSPGTWTRASTCSRTGVCRSSRRPRGATCARASGR